MKSFIDNLKNKNIHIVGVSGTEGNAILEFLAKNGIKNITAHDFSADKEDLRRNFFKTHLRLKGKEKAEIFDKFLKLPMNLKLKDKYLNEVLTADIIFTPSSWYLYEPNFPMLEKAREKGIEFLSLTKLYFELAKGKIISITGTKGKGTTSRLIYDILLNANINRNAYLAGNDRRSAQELDKVSKMTKDDILVLETSNRQLMIDLRKSPDIGVITNISPDHIDEHGSFAKYIEVKKSLFKYAGKSNMAILNYDNEITKKIGEELIKRGVKVFFFSRKNKIKNGACQESEKIFIMINDIKKEICDLKDIKLIGKHNIENILAAVLVGYLFGAKTEKIKKAIQNFRGLPHRIEFVGEYNRIKFYDDLASTNPDSTIAAIRALSKSRIKNQESRIVLIVGGDNKGMNYEELAREIIDKIDILFLLPGTGSEKLKCQITNAKCQISDKAQMPNNQQVGLILNECTNFLEAMDLLEEQAKTGDVVLISPACAHFQARYVDVLKKPIRNLIVKKFR